MMSVMAGAIVPKPVQMTLQEGTWKLSGPIHTDSAELKSVAAALREDLAGIAPASPGEPQIIFEFDKNFKPEEYQLFVADKCRIRAGSREGAARATATLLQFAAENREIPKLAIEDRPDHSYRAVMIDVARKWHSVDTLKQIVRYCHYYKVRYLQLHLTDDQSFTFPSRAYPELTTVNQHGGPSYTRAEIKELVDFADARGVTIVPEIDVPGHSGTLIRAKPDLFKITGTTPYEHHATINFADPKVIAAVGTLVEELCELFPSSPYIHIGGDEADYRLAHQNPLFQQAFKDEGLGDQASHEIYRRFLILMNNKVKQQGRKMIVWEGFGREPDSKFPIPKDVIVMAFEDAYYRYTELVDDGYTVVNASWTPLYVVNRHRWSPEKVFQWSPTKFARHGTIWSTILRTEAKPTERILGGQFCAWEQPEFREMDSLYGRVPAFAERLWSSQTTWPDHEARSKTAEAGFRQLFAPVELMVDGLAPLDPESFDSRSFFDQAIVKPRTLTSGIIRYTLDGKPVTSESPVMPVALTITQTTDIRAALFDSTGSRIGGETGMTIYKDARPADNLLRGGKVTVSGGTEGPQIPELAIDGKIEPGSSWWAMPGPQWLQVDMGAEKEIGSVTVYPYWDGSRYYQYKVEGSADGKSWTLLMDRTTNTIPAQSTGDRQEAKGRFRHIRITMLKGSANPGVHLVELVVEAP